MFDCIPDAPPAESREKGTLGLQFRIGSRGRGGRFVSSFNFSKVSRVPGATSSPSKACRADDNSPNAAARLSELSPSCCGRFLLLAAASSSHLELASNKEFHSPFANTSNLSRSFSFEINPPRGGRYNNFRGIRRKSFHPLSWRTTSSLDALSKANRRAFLNGPFKQWGTLFITETRFFTCLSNSSRPREEMHVDVLICLFCLHLH